MSLFAVSLRHRDISYKSPDFVEFAICRRYFLIQADYLYRYYSFEGVLRFFGDLGIILEFWHVLPDWRHPMYRVQPLEVYIFVVLGIHIFYSIEQPDEAVFLWVGFRWQISVFADAEISLIESIRLQSAIPQKYVFWVFSSPTIS